MSRSNAEAESQRPVAVGGTVRGQAPATVKALAGACFTFGSTFTLPYRGQTLSFEAGPAYPLDAPLLAYLQANGITPTAVP